MRSRCRRVVVAKAPYFLFFSNFTPDLSLNRVPKGFKVPALRGEKCRAPAEGSRTEKLGLQGSKTVNKGGAVLESLGPNNAGV